MAAAEPLLSLGAPAIFQERQAPPERVECRQPPAVADNHYPSLQRTMKHLEHREQRRRKLIDR